MSAPRPLPWIQGEPALADILQDPVVLMVLQRDSLDRDDVRRFLDQAADRLRGRLCPVRPRRAVAQPRRCAA